MHNPNARPDETALKNVSDLLLERYLLDELKPADKAALAQRLADDPVLRDRLEVLRRDDETFARTHDAAALARAARERVRTQTIYARLKTEGLRADSRALPRFAGWKPALGGILLLALMAIPPMQVLNGKSSLLVGQEIPVKIFTEESVPKGAGSTPATPAKSSPDQAMTSPGAPAADLNPGAHTRPAPASPRAPDSPDRATGRLDEEVTRIKGLEPALALFRRTPSGAEPLKPGASVKPGDVVRIGYRAAGRSFGAIFSVDGHGNVTRHWPLSGDSAARLEAGEALLPGAFELDDAPAYERFYLLTAERAFDLKPLLESLHAAKTPAASGLTVVRFDLLKENGI